MVVAETVSYSIIFAVTFAFSIIAIFRLIDNSQKHLVLDWISPVLSGMAFICWLIMVPLHLAFVATESAFLDAPAILWFAFAIIFLLFAIKGVFDNLAASTSIRERVDVVD